MDTSETNIRQQQSGSQRFGDGVLAWIWARRVRTIPIPGIRSEAQAEENAAAMAFGALGADPMHEIEPLLQALD